MPADRPLTAAQRAALNLITERGTAQLAARTDPARGTVHAAAARALTDAGHITITGTAGAGPQYARPVATPGETTP